MLKRQVHPQIALTNDQPLLPLNVLKASCSHFLFASDKFNQTFRSQGWTISKPSVAHATELLCSEQSGRKLPIGKFNLNLGILNS